MRHRYLVLDGMRGVAALSVVLFHVRRDLGGDWFFGHGYLAVDFFFMLSGFVLAHAYGERLKQPGAFWPYVRDRVVRLHPLLILAALPMVFLLLGPSIASLRLPPLRDVLVAVASIVPFPLLFQPGRRPLRFPLNPPAWSRFWELVVNLVYGWVTPRLSSRVLVVAVAAASATLAAFSIQCALISGLGRGGR